MDDTKRQITKIAREVGKFTVQTMKEEGIGTAAKRVARLENKGYLVRKPNPEDGRSQLLYATEKAEHLKNSKTSIESVFYEWLLEDLSGEEKEHFCKTLDMLYWKSKRERQAGFENITRILAKEENDGDGKQGTAKEERG